MPAIRLRQTLVIPRSVTGWGLTDDHGLPRYWPTIWANVLKADLSESTRGSHLVAVEKLYRSVASQTGQDRLDIMIAQLDFDGLESALGGFLTSLRNSSVQTGVDRGSTWASAIMFLSDVLKHLQAERPFAELQAKMNRITRLYSQISPSLPRPPAPIRALPAVVVEDLYRLFDPNSATNPFRTPAIRWRNFLLFLMLLHLGLRRGEAANLRADAIKEDFDPETGEIRYWLNVDETDVESDPRQTAPGLKTAYSRRQLPISEEILKTADVLVQNYRRGARHGFLFGSQKGKPLALRQMHNVFEVITQCLSEPAKRALSNRKKDTVTAHDLRHTCAVYRLSRYLALGGSQEMAIDKLRVFFGWSKTSEMPRHYARAYFESGLADVWNDGYDTFVETLRNLEGAVTL